MNEMLFNQLSTIRLINHSVGAFYVNDQVFNIFGIFSELSEMTICIEVLECILLHRGQENRSARVIKLT